MTRSSPWDPELIFWCISYHLGAFGTFWLRYETRCKMGELVHMFVPRSRVGIFHNERNQSTPLDPKLMFWCISYYSGVFRAAWLPYETRCKTGRGSAKVRAMKSRPNFLQRTHPILPIRPLTDVLVRFVPFGCIRDLLVALRNSVQNGPN